MMILFIGITQSYVNRITLGRKNGPITDRAKMRTVTELSTAITAPLSDTKQNLQIRMEPRNKNMSILSGSF